MNSLVDLPENVKAKAFKEMVLIMVKIGNAEYYERHEPFAYKNNFIGAFNRLYDWLFKEHPRQEPYIFQPATSLGF